MAFCWIAAAVRPSFLATWLVGVPALASAFKVFNSLVVQVAPSLGERRLWRGQPLVMSDPLHFRMSRNLAYILLRASRDAMNNTTTRIPSAT